MLNELQSKVHRLDRLGERSRVHFASKTRASSQPRGHVPKRGKQREINMPTNHLARYYQTLTPWERLPLIVATCQRDDKVEEERVTGSADVVTGGEGPRGKGDQIQACCWVCGQ